MSAVQDAVPGWWASLAPVFVDLACDAQGTLWLDGRAFNATPLAQTADSGAQDADPRIERLQQYLYQYYYAAALDDPSPAAAWYPPAAEAWDGGQWRVVEQLGGGALAVQQGSVLRRVEPGEYLFDGVPARALRGQQVQVRRAPWTTQLDSAFVYLFGKTPQDSCNEECLVRYYLAPQPARLGEVVQALSRALDQACLPYQLKYPTDPRHWLRQDAVVLYIAARHAQAVHGLLAGLAHWLGERLRAQVPLWVQPLLPGLGFAQDPADGRSFGESRCHALALGLREAAVEGGALVPAVQAQFESHGIDWRQAHLETDAEDRFGLRQLRFAASRPASADEAASPLLQEAIRIGHRLCTHALWLGERCTWLSDDADDADGTFKAFTCSMNPSLYDGTLGVAAFLVLLAEQTAQPRFAATARGALRHALAARVSSPLSLYEGRMGVVCQGLWLARRLDDAGLTDAYGLAAAALLQTLQALPAAPQPVDLMHGLAGAILGLLELARHAPPLADQSRALAQALGQRLRQQASPTAHGWHWPERGAQLGLCGLAHGNAGIALAFAQLARDCPGPHWTAALERTLAYEAHWFIDAQGNWPYLFAEDAQSLHDTPTHCGMAWCHGAPGIALARLVLWQLTGADEHRNQARRALQTVVADIRATASQAGSSYTLCHGPAGNADILLTGAALLGEPAWAEYARQVATRGLAAEQGQWRSGLGVAQGQSLGLMLGLAGTGYFLLRCAVEVPSLLLPWDMPACAESPR